MTDAELVKTITEWQRQVWEQIYLRRHGSARRVLDGAWQEWRRTLASPDMRRALEIYLHLLEFDCEASFAEHEAAKHRLIHQALAAVEPVARGRHAESCRARVLLILRSMAHTLGARDLGVDEARKLLAGLPPETLGHQTCMYLALWAFAIRNAEFLQLAYKLFLVNTYDFMLDFSRQRARVMLALVERKCEPADIRQLIDCLPHPLHADWFEASLVPELERQGLWPGLLEPQFSMKRAALNAAEACVPPRDNARELPRFM